MYKPFISVVFIVFAFCLFSCIGPSVKPENTLPTAKAESTGSPAGKESVQTIKENEQTTEGNEQTTPEETLPAKPDIDGAEGYNLVFHDEFNGKIDSSVWYLRTGTRMGGVNSPSNVSVDNGQLKLKYSITGSGGTAQYTGAGIYSKELFGYGYYEVSCTLYSKTGGLHSSFWINGIAGDGISLPLHNNVFEIDGFEFDSDKPGEISHNVFYKIGATGGDVTNFKVPSLDERQVKVGFEWLPDRINWYMDGKLVFTRTQDNTPITYAQQNLWLTALANTEISGKANSSLLPGYTSFDYVRYYAKLLKGVNLLGASEFEYNINPGFVRTLDRQTPVSWLESGDKSASAVLATPEAYAGNCVLCHSSPDGKAYKVTTAQKLYNIANGKYELTAFVKSNGRQNSVKIKVSGTGTADLYVDIPDTGGKWRKITIPDIKVTSNGALVEIISDSGADGVLYVDNISFAATEGDEVSPAAPFIPDSLKGVYPGEIFSDTKSSGFSLDSTWTTSTVIGAKHKTIYKSGGTASNWAKWTLTAEAAGSYTAQVFCVSGNGSVPTQIYTVSVNGREAYSGKNGGGKDSRWVSLANINLEKGDTVVFYTTAASASQTLRADAVRLIPAGTPDAEKMVVFSCGSGRAYVFGERRPVNDLPSPFLRDGILYLPAEETMKALGISQPQGQGITVEGTLYIPSSGFEKEGRKVYLSNDKFVIITKETLVNTAPYAPFFDIYFGYAQDGTLVTLYETSKIEKTSDDILLGHIGSVFSGSKEWKTGSLAGYGGYSLWASSPTDIIWAEWKTDKAQGGFTVYYYKVVHSNSSTQELTVTVNGRAVAKVLVDHTEGSSGWVEICEISLSQGDVIEIRTSAVGQNKMTRCDSVLLKKLVD